MSTNTCCQADPWNVLVLVLLLLHHAFVQQDRSHPHARGHAGKAHGHTWGSIRQGLNFAGVFFMKKTSLHLQAVGGPAAQVRGGVNVLLQLLGQPREVQEQVLCCPQHRPGPGQFAHRVQELSWVQQVATVVALISSCVLDRAKQE